MSKKPAIIFKIDPNSGVPIYKQVMEQVQRMAISGSLSSGDEMPSVRHVAQFFEVNPMTISKAYNLLEAMGYLDRQRGMGMTVSENHSGSKDLDSRMEMLKPVLIEAASQAAQLSIPADKAIEEFKKIIEGKNE